MSRNTDYYAEKCVSRTGVDLTSGDVADVFIVADGPVLVMGLWVDITTAVSAGAALINFESDPTVGVNTPISAAALAPDIASAAVGDVFYITGDSTVVMVKAANGTALAKYTTSGGIFVPIGGIDLRLSTAAPTTGAATVWMRYMPLDMMSSVR